VKNARRKWLCTPFGGRRLSLAGHAFIHSPTLILIHTRTHTHTRTKGERKGSANRSYSSKQQYRTAGVQRHTQEKKNKIIRGKCILMENNSLESLPPPLTTTPAIPTSTTPTATTLLSTAEHAAATNTATIEYTPAAQHQSDQPATGPSSNKRCRDPPYDWQLLPQEERDLIAYNSHRQKKARLRVWLTLIDPVSFLSKIGCPVERSF
jgi:hypothetical protein